MRRHLLCIISLFLSAIIHSQCQNCQRPIDVVFNGDFNQGNTGFTSELLFTSVAPILCPLCPEGRYTIGDNAQEYHNNFSGLDHTQPGEGYFMICNSDSIPGNEIWCQTVEVVPLTFYTFSFWAQDVNNNQDDHPYALLQMRINGVFLPDTSIITGPWQQIQGEWYSGNNTSLELCILNQQNTGGGNDFGIDDISFTRCENYIPASPAAIGNDQSVCGGETILVGMAPNSNYNYHWDGLPQGMNAQASFHFITLNNTTSDTLTLGLNLNADTAGFCITSDSITLTILPFQPLQLVSDTLVCPGDSILIEIPEYYDEVIWSDDVATLNNFLLPGVYTVEVSQLSCSDIDTITVALPPDPSIDLGSDFQACSNNPPILQTDYIGLWSDGTFSTTLEINNPGIYSFSTSINECHYYDTIQINFLQVPSLQLGNDTLLCEGEILTLQTNEIWDFVQWSNGEGSSQIQVQEGNYSVLAILQNCIARDTIVVSVADSIPLNLGNDTTLCEGQQLLLQTAQPGEWSIGITSDVIQISESGTYSFTYGNSSCIQSDTIIVEVLELPVFSLGPDTSICADGNLELTVDTIWENIQWSNGENENTIMASPGIYSVTASKENCTVTDQILIYPINPISLDLGNDTTLCQGSILTLHTSVVGVWNDNLISDEFVVNQPGYYFFEYGNDGCYQFDDISIDFDIPPAYQQLSDTLICRDNEVTFQLNTAWENVIWDNSFDSYMLTVNSGMHWVEAASGVCLIRDTVSVQVQDSPEINIGNDTTLCENSSLTIETSQAGIWNDGISTANYVIESPGLFVFQYSDEQCTFFDSIVVDYIFLPEILPVSDTIICPTDSIYITIENWPGEFTWNNGSSAATTLMAEGVNTVTGHYAGCQVTEDFELSHLPVSILPNITDTTVCSNPGLSITLPHIVEWSNGLINDEILITIGGTYSYFSNELGCVQADTFAVSVQLAPERDLPDSVALCGEYIVLESELSGSWWDGQSGDSALFTTPGTYIFQFQQEVCSIEFPVSVYPSVFPIINLPDAVSFCEDGQTELSVEIQHASSFEWIDGYDGSPRIINEPGSFIINAENECGTVSDSVIAAVYPCNFGLYIPSAFTPNDDNINEGWRVITNNIKKIDIRIYNRFGDLIFSTTDPEIIWNPLLSLKDDIYNYRIIAETFDGKTLSEYGPIYLLK